MLPLELFLNAALLCVVSIAVVPVSSRVLNPAAVPHKDQSPSQLGWTSSSLNVNPPLYPIQCFENNRGLSLARVAEDCTALISELILRGDEQFQKRSFSRHLYSNSNGHRAPARWALGQCSISLEATDVPADRFACIDVAQTANQILSHCMKSHRKGSGGAISNGPHKMSFQIGMQGRLGDGNLDDINNPEIPILPELSVAERGLDAKVAIHGLTRFQRRGLDSSRALMPLIQATQESSLLNSTGNLKTVIDHRVECFPGGTRLANPVVDDCKVIIDTIILGLKDPFRVQTWGYTHDEDNDLSLPEYQWNFESCYIGVRNIDEEQIDKFRPVDVAEQAQNIVQKCVAEIKQPVGGHADIGRLRLARSFYVVVGGTLRKSSQSLGSSNVLSHLSDRPRTLESRAYLELPQEIAIPRIFTGRLEAGTTDQVHCFDPAFTHRLQPAILSDCEVITNEIILRLPNPMREQSFGYTDAEDINLLIKANGQWMYGQCVVFVRTVGMDGRDRFRYVDVALTAKRIMDQCIEESKYARGGTAGIGTLEDNFYVSVGGLSKPNGGNGTVIVTTSDKLISLLSDSTPKPTSPDSHSGTESAELDKRLNHITEPILNANHFAPSVRCFRPGMPAARKIDIQDCTNAARTLLEDSKIFVPQLFTTEPTGGIRMPFVEHYGSCYLTMNTSLDLSVSDSIPLLKMVYWALEVMLKCVAGREQGFGGVSMLDDDKELFVSVTGVDPRLVGKGLANLTTDEHASSHIADLRQS